MHYIIIVHLQELGWGGTTGIIWFRIGRGGGLFEGGNEPSGSLKFGIFLVI